MLILVSYDVNTESESGKKRLRKVAKTCMKYGQRVQNSVFECILDATQYVNVKNELSDIIDKGSDSLRFYNLGNSYRNKVEQIGKKLDYPQDSTLIL